MTDLPEPMSAADCDLRGLEWMPLFGDRLFGSDTWLMASAEGRCAAMALWWASWKQRPAGSVPDQDRALAQLAGYGLAVKGWLAVRDEALRGWVKCSDGRLYHRVVCDLAREAMERRVKERERKAALRLRKNVPRDNHGTDAGQDRDRTRDSGGTGRGQDADVPAERKRQDRTGEESSSLRSLDAREPTGFLEWWSEYPRKDAKGAARKAYAAALRRTTPAVLLVALRAYSWNPDPRFIPHPSTWLNEGRWESAHETPELAITRPGQPDKLAYLAQYRGTLP